MKGIVTLELRDAKTGVVKQKHTQTNSMTDAVYNILNGGRAFELKCGSCEVFNMTNLIKGILGGVMIFSSSVRGDVEPTREDRLNMIGNANQSAGNSASTFRGGLKSVSVDADEVTYVWEFSETQCNGAIKTVCLTSNEGGDLGCRFDKLKVNNFNSIIGQDYLFNNNSSQLMNTHPMYQLTRAAGNDLVFVDGEALYLIWSGGNKQFKVLLNAFDNKFRLDYVNNASLKYDNLAERTLTHGIEQNGYNIITGPICNYVMQGKVTSEIVNERYTYKLNLVKYTKDGETEIEVPLTDLITTICGNYDEYSISYVTEADIATKINNELGNTCFTYNEKLYWIVGEIDSSVDTYDNSFMIIEQNLDGSFIEIKPTEIDSYFKGLLGDNYDIRGVLVGNISSVNNPQIELFILRDELFIVRNKVAFALETTLKEIDNRGSYYFNYAYNYIHGYEDSELVKRPWHIKKLANKSGKNASNSYDQMFSICINSAYIGTKCNISKEVIKTPSDILTLTYKLKKG